MFSIDTMRLRSSYKVYELILFTKMFSSYSRYVGSKYKHDGSYNFISRRKEKNLEKYNAIESKNVKKRLSKLLDDCSTFISKHPESLFEPRSRHIGQRILAYPIVKRKVFVKNEKGKLEKFIPRRCEMYQFLYCGRGDLNKSVIEFLEGRDVLIRFNIRNVTNYYCKKYRKSDLKQLLVRKSLTEGQSLSLRDVREEMYKKEKSKEKFVRTSRKKSSKNENPIEYNPLINYTISELLEYLISNEIQGAGDKIIIPKIEQNNLTENLIKIGKILDKIISLERGLDCFLLDKSSIYIEKPSNYNWDSTTKSISKGLLTSQQPAVVTDSIYDSYPEYVASGALFIIFKLFSNLFENQKLDTVSIQSIVDKLLSYSSEDADNVFKMLALFKAREVYQTVQQCDFLPEEELKEERLTQKKLRESPMVTPVIPNSIYTPTPLYPTYNGYRSIASKCIYSLSYKSERYVYNWLSTKLCYPIELFILENKKRKELILELLSDLRALPGEGRVFKMKCVEALEGLFNRVDDKFKYQVSMEEGSKKPDSSTNELDIISLESQIEALQMLKFEITTLIQYNNNVI